MSNPNSTVAKRPIWKKWWFWVLVVVALMLIGAVNGGAKDASTTAAPTVTPSSSSSASPKKETSPTSTAKTESSPTPTVNAAELAKKALNTNAMTAVEQLQSNDALGEIKAENGTEMTIDRLKQDKSAGVEWLVTSATSSKGKVNLTLDTQANVQAKLAKEQEQKALESKLSSTSALAACRQYGKDMYPYGFKTHDIVGVIQPFTPKDANTWFYKATVDVTNMYGATAKDMTYECSVTGTTSNPQVVEFNVY